MKKLYYHMHLGYEEVSLEYILNFIGPGWHKLVTNLIEKLFEAGWNGVIDQVKEKFGGLRFYIPATNLTWDSLIQDVEQESVRTCEDCGEPGVLTAGGGHWIRCLCQKHEDEHRIRMEKLKARAKSMEKL